MKKLLLFIAACLVSQNILAQSSIVGMPKFLASGTGEIPAGSYLLKQYSTGSSQSPAITTSCGIFLNSNQMIYQNTVSNFNAQGDALIFSTPSKLVLAGEVRQMAERIKALPHGCSNDLAATGYWLVSPNGLPKPIKLICSLGETLTSPERDILAGFVDAACPAQIPVPSAK